MDLEKIDTTAWAEPPDDERPILRAPLHHPEIPTRSLLRLLLRHVDRAEAWLLNTTPTEES